MKNNMVNYAHVEKSDGKTCYVFTPIVNSSMDTYFKKVHAFYPMHLIVEGADITLADDTGYAFDQLSIINKLCHFFKIDRENL